MAIGTHRQNLSWKGLNHKSRRSQDESWYLQTPDYQDRTAAPGRELNVHSFFIHS